MRIKRSPESLLDLTLQPIIFIVLFVYLFGGAVAGQPARLPAVPPAGPARADRRLRQRGHRRRAGRRHHQGDLRPVPHAADRAVGAAVRHDPVRHHPVRRHGRRRARLRDDPGLPPGGRRPRCPRRLAAGPRLRVRPVLGDRAGRAVRPEAAAGAGFRLPGDVPADLRQQRVRPDLDAARAGCSPGCTSTRSPTWSTRPATCWPGSNPGTELLWSLGWMVGLVVVFAPLAVAKYRRT